MRKLFYAFSISFLISSCSGKQYFNSSPEIDVVKAACDAYFKGDWNAVKSFFTPEARIWFNTPRLQHTKLNTDQYIESMKADLAYLSDYRSGKNPDYEDPVYEMIIDNEGNKWVHAWMTWIGKTTNGKEVVSPLHISSQVKEGKIDIHFVYFNALPMYMAFQQTDSAETR